MPSRVFSVRLPVGLIDRLDGVRGGRSRNSYLRGILEGRYPSLAEAVVGNRSTVREHGDDGAMLKALVDGRGRLSRRDARKALGWDEKRFSRAVLDLRGVVGSDPSDLWKL